MIKQKVHMPLYNQPSFLSQQPKKPKKPVEETQVESAISKNFGYSNTFDNLPNNQVDEIEDAVFFTNQVEIEDNLVEAQLDTYLGKYDEYEYTARSFAESVLAYHKEPGYEKYFSTEIMPMINSATDIHTIYATISKINDTDNVGYNKLLQAYLNPNSLVWQMQHDKNNNDLIVGELITKAFEDYFTKITSH
jgi:hypothetical protein